MFSELGNLGSQKPHRQQTQNKMTAELKFSDRIGGVTYSMKATVTAPGSGQEGGVDIEVRAGDRGAGMGRRTEGGQVRYSGWPINMDEREIPDFLSAWLDVVVNKLQDDLHVRYSKCLIDAAHCTLKTTHYKQHTEDYTLHSDMFTAQCLGWARTLPTSRWTPSS